MYIQSLKDGRSKNLVRKSHSQSHLSRMTALTARSEKCSLCWVRSLELSVVLAMFMRSWRNLASSAPLSRADAVNASRATSVA